MSLSETHIETDPQQVFIFAETQAIAMRRNLSRQAMQGLINPQESTAMSVAIWATYQAFSQCQHSPEFNALQGYYAAQSMQLGWVHGLNLRVPGLICEKLPLTTALILPQEMLREMRAVLTLKVKH